MTWQTPDVVLELVRKVGPIGLDPCTTKKNPTGARRFFTPREDGLATSWEESGLKVPYDAPADELAYVNPPYGRGLPEWTGKVIAEGYAMRLSRKALVYLVPARTDTAWWRSASDNANARCLWRGRIRFKGADAGAPFPSAFFYWGPRPHHFCDVFQDHGEVAVLRGGL